MTAQSFIKGSGPHLRAERATTLAMAIADCDPADAAQIMAAAMADMQTAGPQHDALGTLAADATWWAEIAPPHEVQAYVYAGLKQLRAKAIGPKARKEIFVALWADMAAPDKAAFLRAVSGA